jgi:putative MATE family efflux protein
MREARLTTGAVGVRLFTLSLPMVVGIVAIIGMNLADTYFVGRLGARELAAISFTFPVVFFLGSIAMGVGIGTGSMLSRAIGEGGGAYARRIVSSSLLLSLIVVFAFSVLGIFTIDPLFRLMGASDDLLPIIRSYMSIWYLGMTFLVVPMVGNHALRATGDTVSPSVIMVLAAAANVILDPIFIFGLLGFPRLEVAGAALATVFSRAATLIGAVSLLYFREKLISFERIPLRELGALWRNLLLIAVPAASAQVMGPVGMAVVTRIAADLGNTTVAALGAGTRVAAFFLVPVLALNTALVPFVGQNWGAGAFERVRTAQRTAHLFAFWWGIFCLALFWLLGGFIGGLFSDEPAVAERLSLLLRLTAFGFGLQGVVILCTASFNAINRSVYAAALTFLRMFVLLIPFAWIGKTLYAEPGMFAAMAAGDIVAGLVGVKLLRTLWKREEPRRADQLQGADS